MPRSRSTRPPSYRLHKASCQAVVTIDRKDYYLGEYGSEHSKAEYDRLIQEYLVNRRRPPAPSDEKHNVLINEILLPFWNHVETYYVKNGRPTGEQFGMRAAIRPLRRLYGNKPAAEFGPLALKALREIWIKEGLSRTTVNGYVARIKMIFKWAVAEELVPPSVYHGLQAVAGLRRGRSAARETEPVRPVPEEHIRAVLPLVLPPVRAMIELQQLTGMRPGEVTIMRAIDLDLGSEIWTYTPESHKTEHHGKSKIICLGPKAQSVLSPFLLDNFSGYLFSPKASVAVHSKELRANRKTPLTPSQRARKPKKNPVKAPGEHYTTDSYRRAIERACEKYNELARQEGKPEIEVWTPHRIRHNAATLIRKQYGLDAARAILGHSSAEITEIYAEIDQENAKRIMREIG